MPHKIILLIGPSGSGKTSIGKELEKRGFLPLVSYTSRNKRKNERFGEDYYFVSKESFPEDGLVEVTEYDNELYGLTEREVRNKINMSHTYFVCDKHGAAKILELYPYQSIPFYINVKPSTVIERMKNRGDKMHDILSRFTHAVENCEFKAPENIDYYEVNGEAETEEQADYIEKIISRRTKGVRL